MNETRGRSLTRQLHQRRFGMPGGASSIWAKLGCLLLVFIIVAAITNVGLKLLVIFAVTVGIAIIFLKLFDPVDIWSAEYLARIEDKVTHERVLGKVWVESWSSTALKSEVAIPTASRVQEWLPGDRRAQKKEDAQTIISLEWFEVETVKYTDSWLLGYFDLTGSTQNTNSPTGYRIQCDVKVYGAEDNGIISTAKLLGERPPKTLHLREDENCLNVFGKAPIQQLEAFLKELPFLPDEND